jgi:hypothetical protein
VKTAIFALFLLASASAHAADGAGTIGAPGCLVINPLPMAHETIKWSGPCKDGYADGEGVLEWFDNGALQSSFKGTLARGVHQGAGYVKAADGSEYTGTFENGLRDGTGELKSANGDRYRGQFKAGRRHGAGVMVFAHGGRYDGAWERGAAMLGKTGCTVFNPGARAHEKMKWSGPCKDGYADGPGTLEYFVDGDLRWHFEGTLQRGWRNGDGFLRMASKTLYEGAFLEGERSGTGTQLDSDRSRYDGQWKEDEHDGTGSAKYSTGGAYEGQWRGGKYHGRGKLTYNSGKVVEGQFSDGTPVGQAPVARILKFENFGLTDDGSPTGSEIKARWASGPVPFRATWSQLTREQQRAVRQEYDALDEADEPPYPQNGIINITRALSRAHNLVGISGTLRMNVLIDSSGNPVSATVFTSPDPDMTTVASVAVMTEKFKPALCAGVPCQMIYPYTMDFIVE